MPLVRSSGRRPSGWRGSTAGSGIAARSATAKSFVERHAGEGRHDCVAAGCKRHVSNPTPRRACARFTRSCPARAAPPCGGDGSASTRCRLSGRRPSRARSPDRRRVSRWPASSRRHGSPRPSGASTAGCRRSSVRDVAKWRLCRCEGCRSTRPTVELINGTVDPHARPLARSRHCGQPVSRSAGPVPTRR